jgi:hypothetical protein
MTKFLSLKSQVAGWSGPNPTFTSNFIDHFQFANYTIMEQILQIPQFKDWTIHLGFQSSRKYQLDSQLMMIKEKLNFVVGSDKFSLKINEKEEEIIQRIISSLSTLKREEKFPLIGLLASSFESFNDSTKLFPNSIILVRQ